MRVWLRTLAAMAATFFAIFAFGRALKTEDEQPRERRLSAGAAAGALAVEERFTRAASLWLDGRFLECRTPVLYLAEGGGAHFAEMVKVSLRTPLRAPAAPARSTAWVSRQQLDLSASNDADVAARYVQVEKGAVPIVRILKAASYRPNGVLWGPGEAKAA